LEKNHENIDIRQIYNLKIDADFDYCNLLDL